MFTLDELFCVGGERRGGRLSGSLEGLAGGGGEGGGGEGEGGGEAGGGEEAGGGGEGGRADFLHLTSLVLSLSHSCSNILVAINISSIIHISFKEALLSQN